MNRDTRLEAAAMCRKLSSKLKPMLDAEDDFITRISLRSELLGVLKCEALFLSEENDDNQSES